MKVWNFWRNISNIFSRDSRLCVSPAIHDLFFINSFPRFSKNTFTNSSKNFVKVFLQTFFYKFLKSLSYFGYSSTEQFKTASYHFCMESSENFFIAKNCQKLLKCIQWMRGSSCHVESPVFLITKLLRASVRNTCWDFF